MAERQLHQALTQLKSQSSTLSYADASSLLSKAQKLLLQLNALTPASTTNPTLLGLARETFELGALASIRAEDYKVFTDYFAKLRDFYELPDSVLKPNLDERDKITSLYLLYLLTDKKFNELYHQELESLITRHGGSMETLEKHNFLGYPINLEQGLALGSYNIALKNNPVPCPDKSNVPYDEYAVFSEILTSRLRSTVADNTESAYHFLPLSSTKSLLFLDSEGAVVEFARSRNWIVKDGKITFRSASASANEAGKEAEEKETSQMIIENVLGYARQLETIV
ncbi:26S proteasome regulatory subunit rpn12 [Bombardia bombarda]|uniref:26S proteasome regulatory subunit rpn12 n=1 Tax=Bombardia bombarda TaxID=252184 RepID=A0AA39U1K4_9PEZI|nr:26S proteasome regulatory subunit rpn12 [Bombardia bombarda]